MGRQKLKDIPLSFLMKETGLSRRMLIKARKGIVRPHDRNRQLLADAVNKFLAEAQKTPPRINPVDHQPGRTWQSNRASVSALAIYRSFRDCCCGGNRPESGQSIMGIGNGWNAKANYASRETSYLVFKGRKTRTVVPWLFASI